MSSNITASNRSTAPSPIRNNKLIVVIGAESSGNRLIFETLKKASGYADDEQEMAKWWDNERIMQYDIDRITFRSLPHFGVGNDRRFVDPVSFGDNAKRAGYDVRFVVATRDQSIVKKSKTNLHCLGDGNMAAREMSETRRIIGRLLAVHGESCFVWNYETFMFLHGDYLLTLYRWLGIEAGEYPKLIDGNVKYLAK